MNSASFYGNCRSKTPTTLSGILDLTEKNSLPFRNEDEDQFSITILQMFTSLSMDFELSKFLSTKVSDKEIHLAFTCFHWRWSPCGDNKRRHENRRSREKAQAKRQVP